MSRTNQPALLVPIHVAALNLAAPKTVASEMADFGSLPYINTDNPHKPFDANPNTAFISESIVSQPFQNQNFTLEKGIHLHWDLPEALKTAGSDNTKFPAVPNRWLITRKNIKHVKIEKQWVLESDNIFPEKEKSKSIKVPLPFQVDRKGRPFRSMGRLFTLDDWLTDKEKHEYWEDYWPYPLNASGYGEPAFAAFYPNCHSVFGMHDEDYAGDFGADKEIQYEVLGWYSELKHDYMQTGYKEFSSRPLLIHKQPLAVQFDRLGNVVWDQLIEKGCINVNTAKQAPAKDKLNWHLTSPSADEVSKFLAPAPILPYIEQNRLFDPKLLQVLRHSFEPLADPVWQMLLSGEWITPISDHDGIAKINTSFPDLKGELKNQQDILKTIISDKQNARLLLKSSLNNTYGSATIEQVWSQMAKQKWIQIINTQMAMINPKGQWQQPITLEGIDNIPGLLKQLNGSKSYLLTKTFLSEQYPKAAVIYIWDELKKAGLIGEIALSSSDGLPCATIISGKKKWNALPLILQPALPILQGILETVNNTYVLPKQRLEDRYGSNATDRLWKQLSSKKWIVTINDTQARILPVRSRLDLDASFLSANSLFKSDLSLGAGNKQSKILNPQATFQSVQKMEVSDRFGSNGAATWQALLQQLWLLPTHGDLNKDKLAALDNTMAYSEKLKSLLQSIAGNSQGTIPRMQIQAFYADLCTALWNELFDKGWLICEQAVVAERSAWIGLDDAFSPYEQGVKELLSEAILGDNLIEKRSLDNMLSTVAYKLWDEMVYHHWLKSSGSNQATYTPQGSSKLLSNAYTAYESLLSPFLEAYANKTLKRIQLIAFFARQSDLLWKALLSKKWIVPQHMEFGLLAGAKPWEFAGNLSSGDDQLQAAQYINVQYKKAFAQYLEHESEWYRGIKLEQADENWSATFGEQLDAIWKELLEKKWLLPATASNDSAIIAPRDYRQDLAGAALSHVKQILALLDEVLASQAIPTQMLCFGRVTVTNGSQKESKALQQDDVEITIANSGTEAISAKLAALIDPANKGILEDQLEAIQFARILERKSLDIGPAFEALRHTKSFRAHKGGAMWTVKLTMGGSEVTLPNELAHDLNELNLLQRDYEKAQKEIDTLRSLLFSDWYKYMMSVYPPEDSPNDYPDIEDIRHYMLNYVLTPLKQKIAATGELFLHQPPGQMVEASAYRHPDDEMPQDFFLEETLAYKLALKINNLAQAIALWNKSVAENTNAGQYTLEQVPGPRYWEPEEPHVLLSGNLATATVRNGKHRTFESTKLLACQMWCPEDISFPISKANCQAASAELASLIDQLETAYKAIGKEYIAFTTCSEQPWHPLFLEWYADFIAVNDPTHVQELNPRLGYDTGFIKNNYQLPEDRPGFTLRKDKGKLLANNSYYTGMSTLFPDAQIHFRSKLAAFLQARLGETNNGIVFKANDPTAMLSQYESRHNFENDEEKAKDPILTALRAYRELENLQGLSQSLSGFNDALLMHKQTLQLPVGDPLGFDDFQAFAATIKQAVGTNNAVAPEPLNDFNPIRAGALQVRKLRLVDAFGQVKQVNPSNMITTEKMKYPYDSEVNPVYATLYPRFTQAAHLHFRWMAADMEDVELNTHPAANPVCGWILPNNLDESLMIYDSNGALLGYFDELGVWQPPPGLENPVAANAIGNATLRNLVAYLQSMGKEFQQPFISTIDAALENIHPEYFDKHQDLALLMGRPIAVVRVSLGVALQSLPATHQGWDMLRLGMLQAGKLPPEPADEIDRYIKNARECYQFTAVKVPVRLGDYLRLNDGLVGYWEHNFAQGTPDRNSTNFYASQAGDQVSGNHIDTGSTHLVEQAIDDPDRTLTVLFDPTAKLHATSGMFPVKTIDIPADQYKKALNNIAITFLSAPLISKTDQWQVALPKEKGYTWTWIEARRNNDKKVWVESPLVTKSAFCDLFKHDDLTGDAETLWHDLVQNGWLKETGLPDTCHVVRKDLRTDPEPGGDWKGKTDAVENLLKKSSKDLATFEAGTAFSGTNRIQEGWLKLSKREKDEK